MVHPDAPPKEVMPVLKTVQDELLSKAESHPGSRDRTYEILAPRFLGEPRPCIFHYPQEKAAYISLSTVAADYWNAAEAEMSHEVVHLLNPIAGDTNYLEEGIAAAFAQYAASHYEFFYRPSDHYRDALELVHRLPVNPLRAGRLLRTRFGALSAVSSQHLLEHFTGVGDDVAESLARKFSQ